MWLRRLQADRLRNLKAVDIDLPAGFTVVTGRNGQGKSSLLEALYLLGTGSSFRTRRGDEMVGWDGGPLRVGGEVAGRLGETRLGVVVDGPERRLLVDGAEAGLETFLGRLDLVAIPGDATRILTGGPNERRRFLDRGVVGLEPGFLRALGEYRRILSQRNALLKRGLRGNGGSRELEAWDERLVNSAARVHRRRRGYAVRLGAGLGDAERTLLNGEESLRVAYRPSPKEAGQAPPSGSRRSFATGCEGSANETQGSVSRGTDPTATTFWSSSTGRT
jgi:DNA replication and repair protein RecF